MDEKRRRAVPLADETGRTHFKHVLNWRSDGVTDAIMSVSMVVSALAAGRGQYPDHDEVRK